MKAALLVAVMALVTMALRFLPFLVFHGERPAWLSWLSRVLPAAIMGMLVVYSLRDTVLTAFPYGIPELVSLVTVVVLQAWKRSSLLSILSGTILYMFLIQTVF